MPISTKGIHTVERSGLWWRAKSSTPRQHRQGPRRWHAANAWADLLAGKMK